MDGEGCEIIGQGKTFDSQRTSVSENDDDSYSNEDSDIPEPSSNEYKTFVVLINDDGSLVVDRSGIIDAESSDPQCVIPVSLPVNKLRNPDNPFPGAAPMSSQGGRARKSKPQPVLYTGDDSGYDYENAENYVQMSGTAPPIDMDQLGPQDMAILENVLLQSASGELLDNLSFPGDEGGNGIPGGGVHLWDHSYSALSAAPAQQQVATSDPSVSQSLPQSTRRVCEPLGIKIEDSAGSPRLEKSVIKANGPGRRPNVASPVLSPASQQLSSPTAHSPSIRRVSEGDSANIRRSQRHQDRVERQEAERIKAENQQMLQREKEMMLETQHSVSVMKPMEMSPSPVAVATPVIASPVFEEAVSSAGTNTPSSTSSMDKNIRRPARSRKLPAHLADPNYIQLDEEGKPISQPVSPSINADDSDSFVALSSDTRDEESMDEEPGEKGEEDDPNKLWCICRQPHNNRFMICCDKCDDWFHGKCVGVTKQQAKTMESNNKQWHCPNCRKELKKVVGTTGQTPRRPGRPVGSGRRVSTASSRESESSEVFLPEKKKEIVRSQSLIEPPKKQQVEKQETPTVSRRKSSSNITLQNFAPITSSKSCIVCGNKAREGSVYCSDDCVGRHATSTSKSKEEATPAILTAPASEPVTPSTDCATAQTKKFKRFLKSDQPKKAPTIFAFHVIQTGATKSTEMVPARPKEPLTAAPPSAPRAAPSVGTTPEKNSTTKVNASPSKSTPPTGIPAKQFYSNDGVAKTPTSSKTEREGSASKVPSTDTNKSGSKTKSSSKASQGAKHTPDKRKSKEALREAEKERDAIHGRDTESLMRQNMRKTLQEALKNRLVELQETDKTSIPTENTPERIAKGIEEELTLAFSTPSNAKCKTKYRSIVFNLKDSKNFLFREILQGNITPQQLVKMEPTEMASEELSEWRQKEQQKNLEMIKRAELDKLVEAKKQELLDKGADVEAVEQEQSKKLDLADVLELKDVKIHSTDTETQEKPNEEKSIHSKSHSISRHHKEKSHVKDKYSGNRDRHSSRDKGKRDDKDHRSRHRSRERRSKPSHKDKASSRDKSLKEKKRDIKSSDRERSRSTNTLDRSEDLKLNVQSSNEEGHSVAEIATTADSSNSDETSVTPAKPMDVSADNSSNEASIPKISAPIRQSMESDQELPSSTIKTPDFTEEKKDGAHAPIFKTKLLMHELGQFRASAYNVSHNSLEGVIFPPEPVPIVGRIAPETVWDYIDKMKKTKEVIILRLHPETDADYDGYMAFFKYLSSRGRLGVMGHVKPPLKDCYLIPLDKHSPVNRALLPFHGPGLPQNRDHCLLAAVTRHCEVSVAPQVKRKISSDMPPNALKKKKVEDAGKLGSGKQRRDMVPSTSGIDGKVQKDFEKGVPSPDDDQPYTPWEEEDEKDAVLSVAGPPIGDEKTSAQKLLDEINRQIEQEKEQIANIAVAITRNENISIPGLDGDFPAEHPTSDFAGPNLPFFLRSETSSGEVAPSSSLIGSSTTLSYPPSAASISPEKMDVDLRSGVNKFCDMTDLQMPLGNSSANSQSTPASSAVPPQIPPVVDLDEEAYSPSDYSEDCKVVSVTKDGVTVSEIPEIVVVPSSETESIPQENTAEPILGFDFTPPNEQAPAKVVSPRSPPAFTSFQSKDVELEPPPPGEMDAVITPVLKTSKIALDSVFTLPSSSAGFKPKIQINIKKKPDVQPETLASEPSVLASADEENIRNTSVPVNRESVSSIPVKKHVTDADMPLKNVVIPPTTSYPVADAPALLGTTPSIVPSSMPGIPPLPIVTIPPPGLVPYPPPMNLGVFPPGMVHISRPPMIPIPPPKVGGIGINTSIPPPPIAGMVPTTSIPPPPIRGISSINQMSQPVFGSNPAQSSASSSSRVRPASRFSQQPPGGPGSSTHVPRTGNPSSLTQTKNSGGFQKGHDRYRPNRFSRYNRSRSRSPGRNRSRSRSPSRNRSRSRDRDRRRRRHSSNSKSRSPQSSRRRSRSRSRSPRFSSRSKSPLSKKRYSRSRSPSNRSRRRKSRSVSPDISTPVVKK